MLTKAIDYPTWSIGKVQYRLAAVGGLGLLATLL